MAQQWRRSLWRHLPLTISIVLLLAACGGPHDAPSLFLATPFPVLSSPTAGSLPLATPATPPTPTAAAGATPTALALLTVVPSPAPSSACSTQRGPPGPGTRNQVDQQMRQAAALLGKGYFQNLPQLTAVLEAAGRAYLEGIAGLPTMEQDARARGELADLLALPPSGHPPTVAAVMAQQDQPVLVVSYGGSGGFAGLPLLLFSCQDGLLQSVAVDPGLLGDHDTLPDFQMRFAQAVDLTGAGSRDLVVTATHQGGSGFTVLVGILGWDGRRWAALFAASVPHWQVGQADWQLLPRGSGQELMIDCPAMGPFDHKLLAHPTLTRTYRWDGRAMALAAVSLAPPSMRRDAFNRGEVAFRAGDYRTTVRVSGDLASVRYWYGPALTAGILVRTSEGWKLAGRRVLRVSPL